MISLDKLKVFAKFQGNIDSWARTTGKSANLISDEDWLLIDSIIEDYTIIKTGLASKEYIDNFNKRLIENFEDNEATNFLKSLADKS